MPLPGNLVKLSAARHCKLDQFRGSGVSRRTMASRQLGAFLRTGRAHSPAAFAADCGTRVPEHIRQRHLPRLINENNVTNRSARAAGIIMRIMLR